MSNVYYGTCSSAGDATLKEVELLPIADIGSISELQVGDLLAVYFAKGNEASSVTIKLSQDLEVDEGLTIKTLGVEEDCAYIWQDGEAVIFVCTSINENTESNTNEQGADPNPQDEAYVSIVDCGKATSEFYGVTKLLTKQEGVDITAYLEDHLNDEAAVAPWLLKGLYDTIQNFSAATFAYEYAGSDISNWSDIGTLIIDKNPEDEQDEGSKQQIYIKIPPQATYEYTGELRNNGDGEPITVTRDEVPYTRADQYLENVLDTPLYFTGAQPTVPATDGIPVYLYTQTTAADYPIIGNKVVNDESITKVFGDIIKLGDCVTVNNDSQSPAISLPTTSIGGNANITQGLTVTNDISEAGTLLKNKYAGSLMMTQHTLSDYTTWGGASKWSGGEVMTISGKGHSGHCLSTVTLTSSDTGNKQYRFVGIVGHNWNWSNISGEKEIDSSYIGEWELYPYEYNPSAINTVTLSVDVRNYCADPIKVRLEVYLLWTQVN